MVAVVACGDRLQETLTMIKSALMFSKEKLNFIIFAEDELIESFIEKVSSTHLYDLQTFIPLFS